MLTPVDLVVFDGLYDGNLQQIIFVEVKTGPSASLNKREREIRSAITDGKVKWLEIRVPTAPFYDNNETRTSGTALLPEESARSQITVNGQDGQKTKKELDLEFKQLVDELKNLSSRKKT